MFALAAYEVIAWLLKNINPKTVFITAIVVALFAGYDNSIGDLLYLSRISVFFPFYWLGVQLNPSKVTEFLKRPWIVTIAAGIIIAFFLLCFFDLKDIYSYRGLFTGRNPYDETGLPDCTLLNRFLAYLVSFLMGAAVLSLVPRKRLPIISEFGKRSLQIYFWHFPALTAFVDYGLLDALHTCLPSCWQVVWIAIGATVAIFVALKPFGWPLQPLMPASLRN